MKIDIDPKRSAISWGGGIDDTLGVALLIEQYGAASLRIHLLKRLRIWHPDRLHDYTDEIKKTLQINESTFSVLSENTRQYKYRDMPTHPSTKYALPEIAVITYYMMEHSLDRYIQFSTEEDITRIRRDIRAVKAGQYYVPEDHKLAFLKSETFISPAQFIQKPFMDLNIVRNDVMEMYYEKNLQHLLPLTRSCGVQINQEAKNTSVKIMPEHVVNNVHCGVCPRCLKRKYAFKSIGVKDPTKYIVE